MKPTFLFAMLLILPANRAVCADKAAAFFDDSKVQEIRLYFDNANWYNKLYQAHSSDPTDPYFPVRFQHGDTVLDPIGVRFKGNSSFRVSSVKKSFKLDFNTYQSDGSFLGLKKLNLNNLDLEPDFLREKMFLDFASRYIAAMRAVHCRLYVNDVYYGLYLAVEQPDKTMMQNRFGKDEDGNLFDAVEFQSDLTYHGSDQTSYYKYYSLETNRTANDWSDLVAFIDVLNNTATAELPRRLEPICDIENMLYGIALNILFTNVDSYIGSASEFLLYHRQDTGRFVHVHWDLNEGFGTTGDGSPRISNPFTVDPFWLPPTTGGTGGPGMGGSRPLMEKLWAVSSYKRVYLRQLARMLRQGFDAPAMEARIKQLANLIRPDVYADPNKIYTSAQFETALTSAISRTQVPIYGVLQFVTERYNYLRPVLNALADPSDLRLNELMNANTSTLSDGAGDFDPWLEIHNLGPGSLNLAGFYLTDDSNQPTKWALPARSLVDGAFLLLWLDGETGEGEDHAALRLQSGGGNLYLYSGTGSGRILIDSITYPALSANGSLIRVGDTGSQWLMTDQATAGAANPVIGSSPWGATALLRINEFMASNQKTLEDPAEPGAFEDWFEIYNPGTATVDMGGMFMTDNMANPTKWRVPQGVTISPGGYLVFWADADPTQGNLHTDFQLDSDGEELALYMADGTTLIDALVFPAQLADISYGRRVEAVNSWTSYNNPTPNASNGTPVSATLQLAEGGAGTASTTGTGATVEAGYATVSIDSGSVPYGTAVFSVLQNNVIVSEVGVPASPPTTAARIFIDYRSGVSVMTGSSAEGTINVATGIALANTGTSSAAITYALRGLDGATLATGHGTLGAGAHIARFIDQLSDLAADFSLPAHFDTTVGLGTLDITSDLPLSVVALRMTLNQRQEILYTTTPVADLTKSSSTASLYFPQLADGGGYVTTVILLNTSSVTERGILKIYGDTGAPLEVTPSGGNRGSAFAYEIAPQGALVFETDGAGTATNVGSVQVIPDSGFAAPVGAGLFRYSSGGIVVTESGVPAAAATTHARIYVDRTSGHDTGIAIAAVDVSPLTVTLQAYQLDGGTSAGIGAGTIDLYGNGHQARFIGELIAGLPDGFVGVLDVEAPTPFAALTLRSLYNNRRDFLLTTLPVADLNKEAPAPLVFPQIADGGGYVTQFILLSSGEPAGVTLRLFRDTGAVLPIIK
jgi:spore coat protein CotH